MVSKHARLGLALLLSLFVLTSCFESDTSASVDCRWQVASAQECVNLAAQSACVDNAVFAFPDCTATGCVECE